MDNPVEYKLPPEVKAKWLEALRSGRYTQCNGRLHKNGVGHCCLGVLCEVMELPQEAVQHEPGYSFQVMRYAYKGATASDVLPSGLAHDLGITGAGTLNHPVPNPAAPSNPFHALWELNDSGDFSFAQIADIIEEQF